MNQGASRIIDFAMEQVNQRLKIAMKRTYVQGHLALRRQEGRKIDPRTAEVTVRYVNIFDPYGVCGDLLDEFAYVSKMEFARAPGTEIWIAYPDLPEATRNALWPPEPPLDDDVPF